MAHLVALFWSPSALRRAARGTRICETGLLRWRHISVKVMTRYGVAWSVISVRRIAWYISYDIPVAVEYAYRQTPNINRTLVGNEIVDHSDVVGASPVGCAPTLSPFST